MQKINMYWSGKDWQFLNRLTVVSHIKNDHDVIIWVKGLPPYDSPFWVMDLPVKIRNADEIFDTREYEYKLRVNKISEPEVVRLASDLWSFNLVYNTTEMYCDTDIIALDNWDDIEEVFTTDDGDHYTVALMKSKTLNNPIYKYCIQNIRSYWGNMELYTEACKLYKQKLTHPQGAFHQIDWRYNWATNGLPKLINDTSYLEARGIHYYGFRTSKLNIDESWINKYPNSMFAKLCKKFFKDVKYRR